MTAQIYKDLTPFFADPCWLFVLMARASETAVVLRRGPTRWWHLTLWNTRRDQFTPGQWFRGSFYPQKCDLSPNGSIRYVDVRSPLSSKSRSHGRALRLAWMEAPARAQKW